MSGRSTYIGQAGREVDPLGKGHQLKRNEPLVVVECQHTIKFIEVAIAEEAIRRIGAIGKNALILHLLNHRFHNRHVQRANHAIVTRMRIQSQHGNFGHWHTKVAFERLVHQHDFVIKEVVRDSVRHILQGQMVRYNTYTDAVAHHNHQTAASKLMREILGMSGKVKIG